MAALRGRSARLLVIGAHRRYRRMGVFVSYPCQVYEFDIVTGALRWNYNGGCDGGGGVTTALYDQVLFTSRLSYANLSTGNALLAFNGTQIGTLGNLSSSLACERGVGFSYDPAV